MLKISYNDIPKDCISTSCDTEDANYPHNNLFYGGSTIYWQSNGDVNTATIQLNLDSGSAGKRVDHIILRGLNLITSQVTCGVEVRGSTDNFATSDVQIFNDASISSSDLVGPYNEDFIITGALSAAYKNFKIIITSATAKTYRLRKIFLGSFFDFDGRSPKYPYDSNLDQNGSAFNSDSGTLFLTSRGRKKRIYSFTWSAVTDAIRNAFDSQIAAYLDDYPICLYVTPNFDHDPLNGQTLVCGRATARDAVHTRWKDLNSISLQFIEDIIA